MGRAARKGTGGGSGSGSRTSSVPELSSESILVGFGEELASTPEYDTEAVITTLLYFDPASGQLAEREVEIFFEYSSDQEDDDLLRESQDIKASLEVDLLLTLGEALRSGQDIDNISVKDSFEFEYLSGMSFDRTEPTYSTVSLLGEATFSFSDEGDPPRTIENPLQVLKGFGGGKGREVADHIIRNSTPANAEEMLGAMDLYSRDAARAIGDALSKIGSDEDPRINSAFTDIWEARASLQGSLPENKSEAYKSKMEQLALAADRLEWGASSIERASAKMNVSEEERSRIKDGCQELQGVAADLRQLQEQAAPLLPVEEVSA